MSYSHYHIEAGDGDRAGIRKVFLNSNLQRLIARDFNASFRGENFKPTKIKITLTKKSTRRHFSEDGNIHSYLENLKFRRREQTTWKINT
jgi:hypothetical protein